MKSKEALTYILENAVDDLDVLFDNDLQLAFKTIEKDLKVLNSLKKYLVIESNDNGECQCLTFDRLIFNDDIDTEADFYLIKEWLNEDNQRDS